VSHIDEHLNTKVKVALH